MKIAVRKKRIMERHEVRVGYFILNDLGQRVSEDFKGGLDLEGINRIFIDNIRFR
jgi:hypothetical protein